MKEELQNMRLKVYMMEKKEERKQLKEKEKIEELLKEYERSYGSPSQVFIGKATNIPLTDRNKKINKIGTT